MKKILIIGSWAKEQITIENIKKKSNGYKVFCFLDTKNPGIISSVDDYKIGNLYDMNEILNYALSIRPDLVLITTAWPLSCGITDKLLENQIPTFGPSKKSARLETDKAFTRELMKKNRMNKHMPKFGIFKEYKNACKFSETLDWQVAIKPAGLTDGLGVKVSGEQLNNREEVKIYIKEILDNKIGGIRKVLVEEKLTGEEFTLQSLVYKNMVIPTPIVQDFKKLLPGDRGLNTASMGSYSDNNILLPFLRKKDYKISLKIIKKTIKALKKETGESCCGFLYGQFMLTKKGIKLVEYNFRPGDPEWINTLYILKDNIADKILSLMKGLKIKLNFESKATVCKYIVPENYPEKLNQNLDISFPKEKIKNIGVDFYYSAGLCQDGKLNVGQERGLAFISKANSIFEANKKIEKAISLVKGNFRHREDIGSKNLIMLKKNKSG